MEEPRDEFGEVLNVEEFIARFTQPSDNEWKYTWL